MVPLPLSLWTTSEPTPTTAAVFHLLTLICLRLFPLALMCRPTKEVCVLGCEGVCVCVCGSIDCGRCLGAQFQEMGDVCTLVLFIRSVLLGFNYNNTRYIITCVCLKYDVNVSILMNLSPCLPPSHPHTLTPSHSPDLSSTECGLLAHWTVWHCCLLLGPSTSGRKERYVLLCF